MKPVQFKNFLGINNRVADYQLDTKQDINGKMREGTFLRSATNVIVTNGMSLRRRQAESLVQAMSGAHSLFGDLMVRDSVLYRITLPAYSETLLKILSSNAKMRYEEYNGIIYFTNGVDSGKVGADDVVYPWGLPTPSAPGVTQVVGGLAAGKYRVCVSYYNDTTREEGGVSPLGACELSSVGGLRVALPGATSGATHVAVYVTTENGSVPLLQAIVATGTTFVDVSAIAHGREASQRFEAPLPPGNRVFLFNGCLSTVSGKDIYFGIPYRPGYYLPASGRVPFEAEIGAAVPCTNGVFVAADKTYFMPGKSPADFDDITDVLPYGAVKGTEFVIPDFENSLFGWFGEKGFVFAAKDGTATAVIRENVELTPPETGFSAVIRDADGFMGIVSCGWCVNAQNKGATQFSNYDFTSISGEYGTKADGIYALSGGTGVDASIDLGRKNFGGMEKKHETCFYLDVESAEPLTATVTTGSGESYDYDSRNTRDGKDIQRVDLGRGMRESWFGVSLRNNEGAFFELSAVMAGTNPTQRRI